MNITSTPTASGDLPRLKPLTGALGPKEVAVLKDGTSLLETDTWVVLTTGHGTSIELTSRSVVPDAADGEDGTYVDESVFKLVGDDVDNPTLQRYDAAAVVKKLRSGAGRFLLSSTALAFVTAGFGLWVAVGGESGPSAKDAAAKATALVAWATEPTTRGELDRRERLVSACLRGGEGAPGKVGGVSCEQQQPSFIQDKGKTGTVTAILGGLATLLAGIGAAKQFGPGRTLGGG
jgi:hypothetical protein